MDIVYVGLALLLSLATWGLVELCSRLMEETP